MESKKMTDFLELKVDKFSFRVPTDRSYSDEGVWAKRENSTVQVGLSDYLQQRSGDVAFAEVKSVGTLLNFGDELAVIETIKVNISLSSPVRGRVIEVNPAMESSPEIINQDPYGGGWLAIIEVMNDDLKTEMLLEPAEYFAKIKSEAEQEIEK